jgi:hypothetical protein
MTQCKTTKYERPRYAFTDISGLFSQAAMKESISETGLPTGRLLLFLMLE